MDLARTEGNGEGDSGKDTQKTIEDGGRRSIAGMAQHSLMISIKERPFYKKISFNFILLHFNQKLNSP